MARIRGENEIIERILARVLPSRAVPVGIGDDCAVLRPPAKTDVVVTTDFTLEGRHFRRDTHSARSAGHRTLARGLSDLAAMGANPLAAFLSLALPADIAVSAAGQRWLAEYLAGLADLAAASGVTIAGGDTARAPGGEILADIVLTGTVPRGRALLRTGARAGDGIYVTGSLGGSAAELRALLAAPPKRLARSGVHPQLFPVPRLAVGQALLRRRIATACMDLSDGLSTDLSRLCLASGVRAELDSDAVPLHPLAEGELELALHGGEDYELLFTASGKVPGTIAGVTVSRIGYVVSESGVFLDQRRLIAGGWEHFS